MYRFKSGADPKLPCTRVVNFFVILLHCAIGPKLQANMQVRFLPSRKGCSQMVKATAKNCKTTSLHSRNAFFLCHAIDRKSQALLRIAGSTPASPTERASSLNG